MKYIITERQSQLLKEQMDDPSMWFRRRFNYESLLPSIEQSIADEPSPCDDYEDQYDYAFNRLDWAVTHFLSIDEDFYNSEEYDDYHDMLFNMCKDWFSEMLFQDYKNTCEEA
jgi:hypothetical protein